jgi:hypothetical protein
MIDRILKKIENEKEIEVRQLLDEIKISSVLLEYMLKGMEKRELLSTINCSDCELKGVCPMKGKHKYCKGFGKYWILTGKSSD